MVRLVAELDTLENLMDSHARPLLVPRPVGSRNHARARKFITSHFESLGWEVTTDVFVDDSPIGQREFSNIVATFNPSASRKLVMAAHYESKRTNDDPEAETFVGAHDSAIPCAMLLNLASTLTPAMRASDLGDLTPQFVFFDGEEAFVQWEGNDNTYGARHLAERWASEQASGSAGAGGTVLESIEVLVLLDLIGAESPRFWNMFPATQRTFRRIVKAEQRLRAMGLLQSREAYFQKDMPQRPPRVDDDHVPFLARGVPIVHLISVPFPTTWHTQQDDEKHLDLTTIGDVARVLRVFLAAQLRLTSGLV